ncbi:MAG: sigma-70 family RNA polymerase sigma factor [Isosphaeraceae bacterium]
MEPDVLGRLIDGHARALVLFARQWCDVPDDVVQEAFVKLAAERPTPENAVAWLFTVVRRDAINAGIAARRRRRHEQTAGQRPDWFDPESNTGGHDADAVEVALRALPDDERAVIVAHLWGGLTFTQVAGVLGGSSSRAHRLYQGGIQRLREQLGVPCPSSPAMNARTNRG